MTIARSNAEMSALRKLAQELAAQRKERVSSVHLLAVLASEAGSAGELLRDRRLDRDGLLKACRSYDDEGADAIGKAIAAAREIARRSVSGETTALHVLLALLADRGAGAHRALVQLGVDVSRLRGAAMAIALGAVSARRPTAHLKELRTNKSVEKPGSVVPLPVPALPQGVAVSLMPSPSAAKKSAARAAAQAMAVRVDTTPSVLAYAPRPPMPKANSIELASPAAAARFALDPQKYPLLSAAKNKTLLAAQGMLEPSVGRTAVIEQALDVLAKRSANNPCLVGPAGVGKTAAVRGIAARLCELGQGTPLSGRVLIAFSLSEFVAGVQGRSALSERISALCGELGEAKGRVILFIDDVHELFEHPNFGELSAAIKRLLSRGDLTLIGACRPEDFRRVIEGDTALIRLFSVLEMDEPSEEEACAMVASAASSLGKHHGLVYTDGALNSAVRWASRYLTGRALPDKAISVLDLSGARTSRRASNRRDMRVSETEVAEIVAELGDIPVERLLETDRERMLALETLLENRVVGHSAALSRIARVLRKNAAGLRQKKPIGTFLLLGPTGVGKTETAKAIAEALFHSPEAMTRLDLSEYAEAHAVARLIGAPPGYVGHEAGGQLTESVRRRPYQVVLLDEIEKAHRDVLESFLQVFDEGRLTDGRGRRVDFTNTVMVLTSNLGAAELQALRSEKTVGFARSDASKSHTKTADTVVAAARAALPPELYNRIDEVLCFEPLSREDVARIAKKLLNALSASLLERSIQMDIGAGVVDVLLRSGGYDAALGARPMKRAIARLIEAPLAEMLLAGELEEGESLLIGASGDEIVLNTRPAKAARASHAKAG